MCQFSQFVSTVEQLVKTLNICQSSCTSQQSLTRPVLRGIAIVREAVKLLILVAATKICALYRGVPEQTRSSVTNLFNPP